MSSYTGIASRLRKDTEELEQEAYNLRLQYLQADGEKYEPEFVKWYQAYEMNKVLARFRLLPDTRPPVRLCSARP